MGIEARIVFNAGSIKLSICKCQVHSGKEDWIASQLMSNLQAKIDYIMSFIQKFMRDMQVFFKPIGDVVSSAACNIQSRAMNHFKSLMVHPIAIIKGHFKGIITV